MISLFFYYYVLIQKKFEQICNCMILRWRYIEIDNLEWLTMNSDWLVLPTIL